MESRRAASRARLFGFIEPCSVGSHLLFVKFLEGRDRAAQVRATLVFTVTRALFMGALGAVAAFIGAAFLDLQRGFWVFLGALYVGVGALYLLGRQRVLVQSWPTRVSAGPIRVTRVGEESFLHQVARHVEEAKALKPGIIVLVDRVLRYYVPGVLLIAVGALLFWSVGWGFLADRPLWLRGMYAALSVLVMGYPCALGMATPLALIRGGGTAAERGILMRSGEAFQILKDIDVVVLDKTGTITRGAPRVVRVSSLGDLGSDEILRLAAGAEAASEHPLGRAIVERAESEGVELPSAEDFESITGGGVRARVGGRSVLVGKSDLLSDHGGETSAVAEAVRRDEAGGRTVVLVVVDDEPAGTIAIADPVKNDAVDAVAAMKQLGLRPLMLTGDAERTARAVAAEVGIEDVRARVLPDQKAAQVRDLQRAGHRVWRFQTSIVTVASAPSGGRSRSARA